MPDLDKIKPQWREIIRIVEGLENGKLTFKFQDRTPTYIVEADGRIERKELKGGG